MTCTDHSAHQQIKHMQINGHYLDLKPNSMENMHLGAQ